MVRYGEMWGDIGKRRMRAACRRHVAALVRAIAQVPHLVRVGGRVRVRVKVRVRVRVEVRVRVRVRGLGLGLVGAGGRAGR